MFHKNFESQIQYDKTVSEVSLSKKNDGFTMQILPSQKENTKYLKGKIYAIRGIYDMDASEKQNFTISCNEEAGSITITGNLYNAFNILKENDVISSQFANEIEDDSQTKKFLEKTKSFVLPENKLEAEEDSEDSVQTKLFSISNK